MNAMVSEYFHALEGKRVVVLGIGVSNRPLIRMLLAHGISVTACDRTPRENRRPARPFSGGGLSLPATADLDR